MLTSHLSSSCISFPGIHEPGILALALPPTRCHVCSVNMGKPWSLFGLVRGSATRSNSLAQVSTDMAPSSSCFYFRLCRAKAWLWGWVGRRREQFPSWTWHPHPPSQPSWAFLLLCQCPARRKVVSQEAHGWIPSRLHELEPR